jgi:hypothetical protein
MKACPKCGSLASFNTYFGAYICSGCDWKDDSFNLERAGLNRNTLLSEQGTCDDSNAVEKHEDNRRILEEAA